MGRRPPGTSKTAQSRPWLAILLTGSAVVAVLGSGPSASSGPMGPRLASGTPSGQGDAAVFTLADAAASSVRVSFPQPDVVRFTYDANEARPVEADGVRPTVQILPGETRLSTHDLTLVLNHAPFAWTLLRGGHEVTSSGDAPVTKQDVLWQSGTMPPYETPLVRTELTAPAGTHVYGLGQRFDLVDHAHSKLRSWICDCLQDGSYAARGNGYYVVPFFWTEHGWGGYLNSTADVEWDITFSDPGEIAAADPSGLPYDLYLFAPGNPKGVFDRYTDLTGKPTLPPKWSFEQWIDGVYGTEDGTARSGEAAMRAYIQRFEEHNIPFRSVVVEDWTTLWWFGARWQWNLALYPDPQGFINDLKAKDLKVMLWETPAVSPANTEWAEGARRGVFAMDAEGAPYVINNVNSGSLSWWMEGVSIVDFTNPEALAWWQEKHAPLLAMGIDGYKADGGEEVVHDMVFRNGLTGRSMHNLNAALYNRALYNDLVNARGEGAMTSRSGTVGSQGASGIWNGDQSTGFAWLRNNMRAGLSASNSGLYWWTFDQGGLSGVITREEALRNLQANVVSPWFKMHVTWDHPRPAWDYDAKVVDTYRHYTNVRLQLLDYLYNEATKSHETGVPLTRILAVDFPDDSAALGLWDQFMVGDHLLAAPVLRDGQRERDIHLPRGDWVDLTTGDRYKGPLDLVGYDTPAELLPLFWLETAAAPAPTLPPHPGLDSTWAPNVDVQSPAKEDAPDEFRIFQGHFDGPVEAGVGVGAPVEAWVMFPVSQTPSGEGYLRLTWNTGPSFGWLQENFLNLFLYDAQGNLIKDCGGGSTILCRVDSWPNEGTWRAQVKVWTGVDVDWELAVFVPY